MKAWKEKAFISSCSSHLPLLIHVSFSKFWSHLPLLAPKLSFRGWKEMCRECRGLGMKEILFLCKKSENPCYIFQFIIVSHENIWDMLCRRWEHASLYKIWTRNHDLCWCWSVELMLWINVVVLAALMLLISCSCCCTHEKWIKSLGFSVETCSCSSSAWKVEV